MNVYEHRHAYIALYLFKSTKFTDGTRSFQLARLILVWKFKLMRLKASCFRDLRNLRVRTSKQVTNLSNTAVMNVLGFPCASLGSSTVQLHGSLDSRRACTCSEVGFSSKNENRA
jgi:hypothetical protein